MISIDPFLHRKLIILHEDTALKTAARVMNERKAGCIVIINHSGQLTGIATDRDLGSSWFVMSPEETPVLSDLMTPNPIRALETATLPEVIQLMEDYGVRRIPIVKSNTKGEQKCIGIISLDDLIAAKAIELDQLSRMIKKQIANQGVTGYHGRRAWKSDNRAEARKVQTLNHFHNFIAEKTSILPGAAIEITHFILSCLVRRLHFTAAAHFITQLPSRMQDELLDLPAGPDRTINQALVVSEIVVRWHFDEEEAKIMLGKFFGALGELVDRNELQHVRVQLPLDLQKLFPNPLLNVA